MDEAGSGFAETESQEYYPYGGPQLLDETLDVWESETMSQFNSYYTQITREARVKEREAYESVGITDAWPIVHEEAEDATKGLTYPAKEPRRRIDRVSVD